MELNILAIVILSISMGFYVQTVIGFAGSLTALPILLIVMELSDAISYISIFYLISSIFMVSKEWYNIDKQLIFRLAVSSTIGVFLGILLLHYGKPLVLKKALGLFILLYVGYKGIGKRELKPSSMTESLFGILGGFFSGVFSTGGPLYAIYIQSKAQDIRMFRATMIGVLALVSFVRIPILSFNGMITITHLKYSAFVFPFFFLAQFIGKKTYPILNERAFKAIILGLLLLSALGLLIKP